MVPRLYDMNASVSVPSGESTSVARGFILLRALFGLACVVIGGVLASRPFASLSVLVALVAAGAVVTGLGRWTAARSTTSRVDDAVAAAWVAAGIAIAVWPDLGVRGVALFVGVSLVVGGVGDLLSGLRGTSDERLAAVLKGVAGAVLGVVALAWPDITVLVVAVIFGVRTLWFGLTELAHSLRALFGFAPNGHDRPPGRLRRSFHVIVAAIGLVLALLLGSVSAKLNAGEPSVSGFYAAPSDMPTQPGSLIRSEPFPGDVPSGMTAWRILYSTTDREGGIAVASALVVVPSTSKGPLPVIAWAHGTTGVAEKCAPSLLKPSLRAGLETGAFFGLDQVISNGWALVATDYAGLGTKGPHPYLVGDSAAHSVLDAVRASHELKTIKLTDQTVVWGHSQGGGAALWTGQVAPKYAPDAHVIGVAALAPASDVAGLVDNLAKIPGGSLFASYVLTGYSETYSDVKFADYVKGTAMETVRGLASRCLAEPAALASVLSSVATGMSVFKGDLSSGAMADRLAENVPSGPFEMPLLIAQGEADSLVLPSVQERFVSTLCASGSDVDYRTYEGRDHVPLVELDSPLTPDLVSWTKARFAGESFSGNCG